MKQGTLPEDRDDSMTSDTDSDSGSSDSEVDRKKYV